MTRSSGRDFAYNHANRLKEVKSDGKTSAAYLYNHQGQRVQKTTSNGVVQFHYDLTGQLLAETDNNGHTINEYVYLNGQPLARINANEEIFYYHNDLNGTPKAITDVSQTIVWQSDASPFGEVNDRWGEFSIQSSINNPLRFPGQYYDAETGLHQNWHRDYDPRIGKYMQSDPIGLDGGLNTYGYVGSNPINYFDPDGLRRYGNNRYGQAASPNQALFNMQYNALMRQIRRIDPAYTTARSLRKPINSGMIRDMQQSLRNAESAGFCGAGASQMPNFMVNGQVSHLNLINNIVPRNVPNTWRPTSALPVGFQYAWKNNGVQFRIWGHGPNPNAPAGTYSRNNATVTSSVGTNAGTRPNRTITSTGTTVRANRAGSRQNAPLVHLPLVP